MSGRRRRRAEPDAGQGGAAAALPWWHPLNDGVRDLGAPAVALVVLLLLRAPLAAVGDPVVSLLVAWDAVAVAYVVITLVGLRSSAARLRVWARARSRAGRRWRALLGGRVALVQLPVIASAAGLLTSAYVLPNAERLGGDARGLLEAACAVAVVGGWAIVHLSFLLQYLYLYHRTDPGGGLEFPETPEPTVLDFAYFAFAVGTTLATPDVRVVRRDLRGAVLAHGLLAFVFNYAVLAVALTLLFT